MTKNTEHLTTNWINATKEIRKQALRAYITDRVVALIFIFFLELSLFFVSIIFSSKFEFRLDIDNPRSSIIFIVFCLFILMLFVINAIFLFYGIQSVHKMLHQKLICCNSMIIDVKVYRVKYGKNTRKEYEIRFKCIETSEIYTLKNENFCHSFNPCRYKGKEVIAVTADMKYFIFIKNKYKVPVKPF